MVYTFDKANANAPSKHETQYFEMVGNRAIYHDGWIACDDAACRAMAARRRASCPTSTITSGSFTTSLKTIREYNDLAQKNPDKLKEMQALFLTEAAKYQVLPLDNSGFSRLADAPTERRRRARLFSPTRVRIRTFPSEMLRAFWTGTIRSPPTSRSRKAARKE